MGKTVTGRKEAIEKIREIQAGFWDQTKKNSNKLTKTESICFELGAQFVLMEMFGITREDVHEGGYLE